MFAVLIAMLLAAAAVPQDSTVPPDARTTIAAANAAWLTAMKAGDAAAVAAPYAQDGVFVGPTGAVVKGPDGVARLMRDRFAQIGKVTDVSIAQDGVTRQGSLVYEWGHADIEVARAGAAPVRSRGRYLTVWQKQSNGRWEILRNLSLPD